MDERVDVRTPDLALERAGLGMLGGAMLVHLVGALAGWSHVASYVLLAVALVLGWLAKRRSAAMPARWRVVDSALEETIDDETRHAAARGRRGVRAEDQLCGAKTSGY